MRVIDFEKLDGILLDGLLCGDSVQQLFDRVYKHLQLPLICFDTTFRLVAYAFPRPFYYPNWEHIVELGGASESDILGYNYLEYQEQMYRNGRSLYFDSGTCEGYPQACGPVLTDGRLVAYCGTMIEDAIKDEALRANDLLSRTVAKLIQNSERSRMRDTAERLLIQNECSAAEAAELRDELSPPYAFVIFSGEGRGVSTLEYVRGTLCGPGKGAIGCLAGSERLYILQSGLGSAESVMSCRSVFDMLTRLYSLRCGVSDFFCGLAETSERRAQALLALSFRGGGGRVRTFRENYVEIVEHCAGDYYGPTASQLGCLDTLEDADGELLKTLELYLRSSRRPAAVAEALGLHRNTVINRIRKAEELLGLDLSDSGLGSALLTGIDMRSHAFAARGEGANG